MADAPIKFLPLGAIIQTFKVNGINIVQGFDTQEDYVKHNGPFFGETIGRVANRIKGAQIDSLNNKSYSLFSNDRGNTLHGGAEGWGKKVWDGPKPVGQHEIPDVEGVKGGESVEFTYLSKDGEEGFPGAVEVKVVYTAGTKHESDGREVTVLAMDYEAKLVGGATETIINMTNHSYFNLAGDHAPTTEGTTITLATNQHLPVDETAIPVSGPAPFPGLDTSKPFNMSATEPEIDHCFTITEDPAAVPIDTRNLPLRLNLAAHNPTSGVNFEVHSTEPAFQVYTGDGINVPAVGSQPKKGVRAGFCCEPSRWVNAANVPEWKNQVLLKEGETYGLRIVYKGWADAKTE